MKYWDLKDKKLIAGRLVGRSIFPKIINIFTVLSYSLNSNRMFEKSLQNKNSNIKILQIKH